MDGYGDDAVTPVSVPTVTGSALEDEVRFGPFALDCRRGRLLRHGRPVPLQPQPLRVLCELVRAGGAVVDREALQQAVWGRRHVDADLGLNQCIRRIRTVLGDRAGTPLYIETLRGRGYRFVAPTTAAVTGVEIEHAAPVASTPPPAGTPASRSGARRRLGMIVATAAILATGGLLQGLRFESADSSSLTDTRASGPVLGAEPTHRLAVRPFVDLGEARDRGYVARGLRDELVATLAAIAPEELAVWTLPEDGSSMSGAVDVDLVLDGSVLRLDDTVQVSLQLHRQLGGRTLWAASRECQAGELLTVQTELVEAVAEILGRELDLDFSTASTELEHEPAAWQAFFDARYRRLTGGVGAGEAREVLRRATERYPDFARGWLELARAELTSDGPWTGRNLATREALDRALALDPALAEAHLLRADIAFFHDWDWPAAERHYQAAARWAPGRADAHKGYAFWLSSQKRHVEAVARVERAVFLDPVSTRLQADLGFFLMRAGRWQESVEACRQALDLDPSSCPAQVCLIEAYTLLGQPQAAVEHVVAEMRSRGAGEALLREISSLGAAAVPRYFNWSLERRETEEERDRRRSISVARDAARAGQPGLALDWLERAEQERSFFMPFVGIDPAFRELQGHDRFVALLERLRLE